MLSRQIPRQEIGENHTNLAQPLIRTNSAESTPVFTASHLQNNFYYKATTCWLTSSDSPCSWPGWSLASHESSHLYVLIPLQDCHNPDFWAHCWKNNIPSAPCSEVSGIHTARSIHKGSRDLHTCLEEKIFPTLWRGINYALNVNTRMFLCSHEPGFNSI